VSLRTAGDRGLDAIEDAVQAEDERVAAGRPAAYFADVEAPVKQMLTIPDAGHFAAFVQPEVFLRELLAQTARLTTPR
jgi:pimeloyl-ACP methyl ester carboxylesterase